VITRRDLPAGVAATQAAHAALSLSISHPAATAAWDDVEGTLVLLTTKDELSLDLLFDALGQTSSLHVPFHEPDLGFSLTAVAILPDAQAKRLLRPLPLLLPPTSALVQQREEVIS